METVSKPSDIPEGSWRCDVCDKQTYRKLLRFAAYGTLVDICQPCVRKAMEAFDDERD